MKGKFLKDGTGKKYISADILFYFLKNKPNRCSEFYFEIDDIIEYSGTKIRVLNYYKNKKMDKYYQVLCEKCGFINNIKEGNIFIHRGCPVCSNKKIIKGVNDVATSNPWLTEYFENVEEAFMYSSGSTHMTNFICPSCGAKKENKTISYMVSYGFRCDKCMDGISKPNKIMRKFLETVNEDYETEKRFSWSGKLSFDFFIPSKNIIIEMDGQHHSSNVFISYKDYIKNDELKNLLAKENNITVIHIDSYKSDFIYIYDKIKENLSAIYKNLDFDSIKEKCMTEYDFSYIVEACNIWNKYKPITAEKIGNILHLSQGGVNRYLKIGNQLGLCKYDPNENRIESRKRMFKKVICVETQKIYNSAYEASLECLVPNKRRIQDCCRGTLSNYEGLRWRYI